MRENSVTAVLDRPDQERVRADLAAFFGPHASVYLKTYDRMRSGTGIWRFQPIGWSWAAFLSGFTWFFYRKMYLLGAIFLVLPIALALVIDADVSFVAFVQAMFAKGWYVQTAMRRLAKADALGLAGEERSTFLRHVGGVSIIGGALASVLYACLIAIALIAAVEALQS